LVRQAWHRTTWCLHGSEFEADFARLLEGARHPALVHLPQDARTPAHAERFHRTIQESFVDDHEDLPFTALALFNRKLADWLVFDNA
jgi:hypothetical protein